jgi:hypothetical protein
MSLLKDTKYTRTEINREIAPVIIISLKLFKNTALNTVVSIISLVRALYLKFLSFPTNGFISNELNNIHISLIQ